VAVWLIEKDDAPYDYSGETLNLPGLYPSEIIDYEIIEEVDGKRTVYFRIFPFQYNDSANKMYVYRNITFGFVTGPAEPKPPVRLSVTNDFESEITAGASTVVGMFIDNYGTGDAKDVNITEEIPGGFNVTFVSTGGTFNTATDTITWEIQNIGSEDFKMLNYELVAPEATGNYTINTTIEYTDENGTVYPAINISKFIIVSGAALPDLTLTSEDIRFIPSSPNSTSSLAHAATGMKNIQDTELMGASSTINSSWTSSPPMIDGTLESEEWDDAARINITYRSRRNCSMLVMNDEENLYIAFDVVTDTTNDLNKQDVAQLGFDGDHDNIIAPFNTDPFYSNGTCVDLWAKLRGNSTESTAGWLNMDYGRKRYQVCTLVS